MENFDSQQVPEVFESSLESDKHYFNTKFPAVGNWVNVELEEDGFEVIADKELDLRPNRINVTVRILNDAPNAPSRDDSIFVCYYTLGDTNGRDRAEELLAAIYKIYQAGPTA